MVKGLNWQEPILCVVNLWANLGKIDSSHEKIDVGLRIFVPWKIRVTNIVLFLAERNKKNSSKCVKMYLLNPVYLIFSFFSLGKRYETIWKLSKGQGKYEAILKVRNCSTILQQDQS